jgi:hypothetical protein
MNKTRKDDNVKVECDKCKVSISKKSMAKHKRSCERKKPKKNKSPVSTELHDLTQKNQKLQKENQQLMIQREACHKALNSIQILSLGFSKMKDITYSDHIDALQLTDSSKASYKSTLNAYDKFCTSSNLNPFEDSSTSLFLNKPGDNFAKGSLKKMSAHLKVVLSGWNAQIKVPKIRNVYPKARLPIGKDELNEFVQKATTELGLMAKLMYNHALRINTVISAHVPKQPRMVLKDQKTCKSLLITCEAKTYEELKRNLNGRTEGYLFYPLITSNRVDTITKLMNTEMKMVFKRFDKDFLIASHCFRRGAANLLTEEIMKELSAKVGSLLGHSGASSATHYIEKNTRERVREMVIDS